jgi:endonuclease-3 related protein
MQSALELFKLLKNAGFDNQSRDSWWWPNSGSYEVVVGAILTQNTTWLNVQKALDNLKNSNNLNINNLSLIYIEKLQELIRPSGFYKAKSKNIKQLSTNILNTYGTFENFKKEVTRNWLLEQKGIGCESADAILNYACYKDAFVVDSYTNRLLRAFGYEFSSYLELQEWIEDSFYSGYSEVFSNLSRANAYARAHGMVVEYCKINSKKGVVDIATLTNNI